MWWERGLIIFFRSYCTPNGQIISHMMDMDSHDRGIESPKPIMSYISGTYLHCTYILYA